MKIVRSLYILLLGCLSINAVWAESCPDKVRVTFFDFDVPPLFFYAGGVSGSPAGSLVDWINLAIKATGCKTGVELTRRPVKRAYMELANGWTDFIAISAVTPERIQAAAFPMVKGKIDNSLSFLSANISLWVRRDEKSIHWDGKTITGVDDFKVGVAPGTEPESLAKKYGWSADAGINGPNTLDKLVHGRVPVALISDLTVYVQPEYVREKLVRLTPAVSKTYYFSIANKAFYTKYPAFVNQYWHELCAASRGKRLNAEQLPLPACK